LCQVGPNGCVDLFGNWIVVVEILFEGGFFDARILRHIYNATEWVQGMFASKTGNFEIL